MVNKRVQNAVLGCNLKNDRMISVRFQGKPFNITLIQVYAPTSNAEEAEVKRFYEDLQDLMDARNIRSIVLMRPINSMIEFKQIIGRGTRLYDGKNYFTIYDFVKAHKLFNDSEWDGEP